MSNYDIEKIEDYLSGKMTSKERLLFESEMASDKELASFFKIYSTIETKLYNIEKSREEEVLLRKSLNELQTLYSGSEPQQEEEQKNSPGEEPAAQAVKPFDETSGPAATPLPETGNGKLRRMAWINLAKAAAVIGIVLMGAIWLLRREDNRPRIAVKENRTDTPKIATRPDTTPAQESVSPENIAKQEGIKAPKKTKLFVPTKTEREALYARNFKPDTIPSSLPEQLQAALEHYKKEEYKDAVAAIDMDAIKTSLEDNRLRGNNEKQKKKEKLILFYAHYYKALSYMADNKAEKALPELRAALAGSPDDLRQSKAQWYMALASLKTGRPQEAEVLLNKVAGNGQAGEYRLKAKELLGGLSIYK